MPLLNSTYLRYSIVFFFAVLFQATVVDYFRISFWKPDLIQICIVILALSHGQNAGSTGGFISGLLSDLVSSGLFGLGCLSRSVSGFVAGAVPKLLQESSSSNLAAIVKFVITLFISGLVHDLIFFYVDTLGKDVEWWIILFVRIFPNLFYTALVGAGLYLVLNRWISDDE